jgi:hypothetical protein
MTDDELIYKLGMIVEQAGPGAAHDLALGCIETIERLRTAIREHRDERGDRRCWLDDGRLYAVLGDGGMKPGDTALPPREDFLKSCERYWRQRQAPLEHGRAALPGHMTIGQLTAEVERLRAVVSGRGFPSRIEEMTDER